MSKIAHSIGLLRDELEGNQFAQMQLDLIEQHYDEATNWVAQPDDADRQTFVDNVVGKEFDGKSFADIRTSMDTLMGKEVEGESVSDRQAFVDRVTSEQFNDEPIPIDAMESILSIMNGDSRSDWLSTGMALHNEYNGSQVGFELWDEWSSKFNGYIGTDDNRKMWDSFSG